MKQFKARAFFPILALSLVIFFTRPFALDQLQAFVLASLVFTVACWATSAIHKTWASLYLLAVFMLTAGDKPWEIASFLWSPSMLLIISTSILSLAIVQSEILQKPVAKVLRWSSQKTWRILIFPYILGLVLIFFIPQAFARVSIVAAILASMFKNQSEMEKSVKSLMIFHSCLAITMTYMFFPTGDIVLNGAALSFSGPEVSQVLDFWTWFKLMSLPTVVTCLVVILLTYLLFRREFQAFGPAMLLPPSAGSTVHETSGEKRKRGIFLLALLALVLAWMSEGWHGIDPWICTVVVLIIAFALGFLDKAALSAVNPHFLIFLTAAFSIGKGLGRTGISDKIFSSLQAFLPAGGSWGYLLLCAALVLVLHLFIGSSVATLSLALPILLPVLESQGYAGAIVCLMFYFVVNVHFLLPFHHATMMLGVGQGYYSDKHMLRLGLPMGIVCLLLLYLVYFPWWHLLQYL